MSWKALADDTREQNPGLASLLDSLEDHVGPSGMSTELAEELNMAKFHMHAKRNFLEESALYETLERYRFASSASSSPSQQHVRHVIDNVLTQIEVSQLMMGAEEGSEDTLAAAETQIQKQLNSLGNFKEPLIATVEGALQERASEIALVHSTASSSTTKSLQDIVKGTEMELEWLEKWKVSSVVNRVRHNQTLTSLFNTLYNSVGLLWEMIQEFKIQHQLEKDMAFHNYFDAVIQSALLKLQLLEGHLIENVYDPKTMESLMNARRLLIEKQESLARELTEKDTLLHKYQNVGRDFAQIVSAYEEVKKHIEIVLEDIQQFQQT